MSLVEYKRKRRFAKTPEPAGKLAGKKGRSFVIQKHQASHLHFDFRLELDGVLKSWAVPKGPSLDPKVKRLAMHVEDHPVAYGSFEGIIPQGEYGGGTVMLWDRGEWEPVGDPEKDYKAGRLKFILHGEKLQGRWMLVRAGGGKRDERQWLLFKERDEWAKIGAKANIVEDAPLSVATNRNLDEIAADADAKPTTGKSKMPRKIVVQLASLVKQVPPGDEWLHEIKYDGYRMICHWSDGVVRFVTRNHNDWTKRLPALAAAAKNLPATNAILDGEVVALTAEGGTDFQTLQNAFRDSASDELVYYAFDLLHLNGHDLTSQPLEVRKQLLAKLLAEADLAKIRYSEHVEGHGAEFLKQGCQMHLEGIICKRRDGPYRPGRGYDWLKVKCGKNEEFVIGGYTEPSGSRGGFGAILVGYHNDAGELVYAGKVGTGFDDAALADLQKRFQKLEQDESPFINQKRAAKTHWLEPALVAQIAFGSRTREGILRHAAFQGLREDKPATDVTQEKAIPLAKVKGKPTPRTKSTAEHDPKAETFGDVRLTSPDKLLYAEQGITKLELATYYQSIADWILPHLADRPLVLVRCPEGREQECFYQKHPAVGTPDTLRQIPIREKNKTGKYVLVDDVKGLISLAQISALEIHAWGSREDKLEYPDRLIFDLDPDPEVSWEAVIDGALQVRQFLQDLGLESFVKTTGGKGLHLVLPIERRHDWEEAKAFCKRVSELIVAAAPDRYTANMAKAARHGKIFIDYLRNGRGATAVVPYSTRSRPGAPVSAPLAWDELDARIRSDQFTIRNLADRLKKLKRDPWHEIWRLRQRLAKPIAILRKLP